MSDYKDTPSFFNSEEVFKKYLGNTSYYTALRNAVTKLVKLIKPEKVVELGAATGATTIMLAKKFKSIDFFGSDIRPDVVEIAKHAADKQGVANAAFGTVDMCRFAERPADTDFVFLLYSFHHIVDPLGLKEKFFADMFRNMKKGAYLCIAESFIPEDAKDNTDAEKILELWNARSVEGGASTYWNSLSGLSKSKLRLAKETAEYCGKNELVAGGLVAKRQDEYLVKRSWVVEQGGKAGFVVVINEPVNAHGDGVILLRKS